MVSHNHALTSSHLRKRWQKRVRTWFNQPARKFRRHASRVQKAKKVFPCPTKALHPAVRCPTLKHNLKLRSGKGFTLRELKAAGLEERYARSIGIAVDKRRHNKSQESLDINTARLLEYVSKVVVLPSSSSKKNLKSKDGKEQEIRGEKVDLSQYKQIIGEPMPVKNMRKKVEVIMRKVTKEEAKFKAVATLRRLRRDAREGGMRAKHQAEKAAAVIAPKKK